jgi:hypothetical protein
LGRIFRLRTYVNLSRFIPNQTQMSKRTAASTTLTVKSSKKKATTSASTASAAGPGVAGSNVFSGLRVRTNDSLDVDMRRVRTLLAATRTPPPGDDLAQRPVIYWMSRDQRLNDNWAFLRAAQVAREHHSALHVAFCLARSFPDATRRAYDFMLRGLQEVAADCGRLGVPFHLLRGDVAAELPRLVDSLGAQLVVCDFSPLRIARKWRHDIYMALKAPKTVAFEEVDAHNIVPCWRASDKQEWAARTLRIKYAKGLLSRLPLRVPQARRRPCRRRAAPPRRRPPPHRPSTGPKSLAGCRPTTPSRQWRGWRPASAPPTPRWRSSARPRASRST